jgi:hypothetical protein
VIFTAPASPQWWQGRKRSYLAIAELAPQTLDATDTGRLAPQVTAGMVEPMTSPARDHVPQIHVPATPSAHRTLEPRPADARQRLVPYNRDRSSID